MLTYLYQSLHYRPPAPPRHRPSIKVSEIQIRRVQCGECVCFVSFRQSVYKCMRVCVCVQRTPLSLSFSLHKSPYLVTYIPSVSAIAPPIQTIMASEGLVWRLWAQRYSWGGPSACLSAPNAACLLRIFCGNQWPSLIFRHHLATTPLFLFPLPPPETFIFLVSTPFFLT